MGERTSHAPGTFSWADLSTTDTEGAKAFYTGLFGWDTEDNPMPEGGVYTMLSKGGKAVAALSQLQAEGQPVVWNSGWGGRWGVWINGGFIPLTSNPVTNGG